MSTMTEAPAANGGGQLTIKQRLQSPAFIAALAEIVPTHCKPERMARIAITAITRVPKLAECDQASFFRCLMDLSQWGLEPDGRRAHLIPFENKRRGVIECQLIIDYKGYVELAYRSGFVQNIHADVVREGDVFDYSTGRVVKHVPHFLRTGQDKPAKPGNVFAVYCVVELKGGTVKTEVLSSDEVEGIRKRSRAGNNGPWVTDWSEMAKKTAFRRATKWLPLSAEIREAFEADDDVIEGSAAPSAAHKTTIDDLSAILKGEAAGIGYDETSQGDAGDFDGGEVPKTGDDVDQDLLDLARMDIGTATDQPGVDFVTEPLLKREMNDATRAAIEGMAKDRKAALAAADKKASGKK